MKRSLSIAFAASMLVAVSLVAQSPKGWMVRADRSTSASDPDGAGAIKFVTMGSGFHATNPQAAVYYLGLGSVTAGRMAAVATTACRPSSARRPQNRPRWLLPTEAEDRPVALGPLEPIVA